MQTNGMGSGGHWDRVGTLMARINEAEGHVSGLYNSPISITGPFEDAVIESLITVQF